MSKSFEYYISKGYSENMAKYFANGKRTVIGVIPNDDFTLTISFDNEEIRIYDVKPLLQKGTIFENIMKIENFNRVYVDENNCIAWDINPNIDSSIIWNNKIDLCPDSCYVDSKPML